ncbi:hypothetical protein CHISP_3587 [Chitinispirillum alkaliphilum]|nr:hypothetical protein CHISP_3587 [Chitinispirillum alkaliphilum]
MFPICMGMNRKPKKKRNAGDMFPICMGMNRKDVLQMTIEKHVPHMHGDEPNATEPDFSY